MGIMDIKEKIDKGGVLARTIIEILGKPKDHVEKARDVFIQRIGGGEGYKVLKKELSDVKEQESLFSVFVEFEVLFDNVSALIGFCFDHMPSSVEIIEPEKFSYKGSEFAGLLNDLQARLHQLDMMLKNKNQENSFLIKDNQSLVKNVVRLAVLEKEREIKEIASESGLKDDVVKKQIEIYEKAGFIKKDGEKYIWMKQNN